MIKYAELPGYRNCGELIPFSHFYQFIQKGADTPVTIVLHAYEGETKAFKGCLFHKKKTFENVPLTTEERKALNHFVGEITQVDLDELLSGSDFEKEISGYQKTGASAVNRFSSYDGKMLSEFEYMPSLSYYCHNYYKGLGNDILYAESDDDNRTYYKIDGDDRWFAESLSSEGNIIHVYPSESISEFI